MTCGSLSSLSHTVPRQSQATRRAVLVGLAALGSSWPASLSDPAPSAGFELAPPLRGRSSGIKFGCAGAAPLVQADALLQEKFAVEADIFIPEGHLKWDLTEPAPNQFDFAGPDSILDFARWQKMLMHGHTLVWYAALPPWVLEIKNARDARSALARHIETLVSRYRGAIWAWDVVNEPVEPKDGLQNDYRNSIWFRLLGGEHVELAFALARNVDRTTPLSLNEYGFEYTTAESRRRRQSILALLRRLRERKVPVDCFGMQSHLNCHQVFDRAELAAFLREVVGLGYRLLITELDVNDVQIPGGEVERDQAVAQHVENYLDIVFSVAKPISISTWGLSDRATWLRIYYKRSDGTLLRPLPLDRNLNRKKMWAVLARYLSG